MIITLTGFMGCGKSSVGRELASLLGWLFIDLDEYIVHKAGRSIKDIIDDSEQRFRAMEAEALRDVMIMREIRQEDAVIALGGGTVLNPESAALIQSNSKSVYLRAEAGTILARLGGNCPKRPLFHSERIGDMIESRRTHYEKAAFTVDTDGKTVTQIANEIKKLL